MCGITALGGSWVKPQLYPDLGQVLSPLGFSFSICEIKSWYVMGLKGLQALVFTQRPLFWQETQVEYEGVLGGLSGRVCCEKYSSTSPHLITHLLDLATSSGFGTREPHPPAHILAHLAVCHGSRGQGAGSVPASHCPSPLPQVPQPGVASSSSVPKPGSSLSYKSERTWKLKQEKPRAGARGLLGQLGKDNPGRATTLFIGALGETYMVRKRTSSYHKTQSRCCGAGQSATRLTQRQVSGVGSTEQSPVASRLFFPKGFTGCGVLRNSVPFHTREGGTPTEGEGLPEGHPGRAPQG